MSSERPVTPWKPFDYEHHSRVASEKPTRGPVDPFEGVILPKIPREPRPPTGTDLSGARDTDADALQDAELGDGEKTPADREKPQDMILRKLAEVERAVKDSTTSNHRVFNLLIEIKAEFGEQLNRLDRKIDAESSRTTALERRMTAYELADRWVPRFAWLATTTIAVIALLRTYH